MARSRSPKASWYAWWRRPSTARCRRLSPLLSDPLLDRAPGVLDGRRMRAAGRRGALDERQRFLVAALVRERLREVVEHDRRARVALRGVAQDLLGAVQLARRVQRVREPDRRADVGRPALQ